jgi:tetratricopeptide (TPR) repeat protein
MPAIRCTGSLWTVFLVAGLTVGTASADESFYEQGKTAFEKRDYDLAIACFNKAIEVDPSNSRAYTGRGASYSRKQEYDKAIADLSEAIRLASAEGWAYAHRGNCYLETKAYDKAITDYTKALKADLPEGERGAVFSNRGVAWRHKGEYTKAIADQSEAIRLRPKDGHQYGARADTYLAKRDYSRAIADYTERIRLDPDSALPHNQIAWISATCPDVNVRNAKRAVEHATKACKLTNWKDWNYLDTLAAAYAEAGDFDEAVKYGKQSLDFAPDNEKEELRKRLKLYKERTPYHEDK